VRNASRGRKGDGRFGGPGKDHAGKDHAPKVDPPRTLEVVARERKELERKWSDARSRETQLRPELDDAAAKIALIEQCIREMRELTPAIEAELKGIILEHESWASGRMPAKLDTIKKDLLDIVAQILPDLQARYSDVWVDHLVAVGEVEEREAALTPLMDEEERLRAAQLEEVRKIPAASRTESDREREASLDLERRALESERSSVNSERHSRADYLDRLRVP